MTTPTVESVPIEVKNWPDAIAKPRLIAHTTIRTVIIDPAAPQTEVMQVAAQEPKRVRMAIIVSDSPVIITSEAPRESPDTSTAAIAPMGGHLPVSTTPYEFYGPDSFWINSISGGATARVTVIKEYSE